MPGDGPPPRSVDPRYTGPGHAPPHDFDVSAAAAMFGQGYLNDIARDPQYQSAQGQQAMYARIASEMNHVRMTMTPPPQMVSPEPVIRFPRFPEPAAAPSLPTLQVRMAARGNQIAWTDISLAAYEMGGPDRSCGLPRDSNLVSHEVEVADDKMVMCLRECNCGYIWFSEQQVGSLLVCPRCRDQYLNRVRTVATFNISIFEVVVIGRVSGFQLNESERRASWIRMPRIQPARKPATPRPAAARPRPARPAKKTSAADVVIDGIDILMTVLAWAVGIGLVITLIVLGIYYSVH